MTEDLNEHEIDALFRRGLEDAQDNPSPGLWSAIEKGLGPTPPPPAPPSVPSGGPGWMHPLLLKGLAGIAILATVGTASYYIGRDSQLREQRRAEGSTETSTLQPASNVHSTPQEHHDAEPSKSSLTPAVDADGYASPKSVDATVVVSAENEDAVVRRPETPHPSASEAAKSAETAMDPDAAPPLGTQARIKKEVGTYPAGNHLKSGSIPKDKKSERSPDQGMPGTTALATKGRDKVRDEKIVPPPDLTAMERKEDVSPIVAVPTASSRRFSLAAPRLDMRSLSERLSPAIGTPSGGIRSGSSRVEIPTMYRFSLMPMLSANTTFKKIEEDKDYGPRNGREHREIAETESYGTTVSPGLYAAFDIMPRLTLQSGFSEIRNEIRISPKDIKAVRDRDNSVRYRLDCSAGTFFIDPKTGTTPIVGDSIRLKGSEVRTRYASIPLHLMYHVGNGRLKFFGMAGAEMNILVNRNATTTFQNAASLPLGMVRAEGLRPTTVNAVMGAGLELGVGKRMALSVIPQYRTALRSANEQGPVKTYPKTFSVAAGVRVRF
jgi:hypothetical protein